MAQLDQDMWQDFVMEAEEHIHEIEPNLLLLEQHPEDMSLIADCFRGVHSIKGAAGYMGLKRIHDLSHALEDLFDQLKNGRVKCDTDFINVAFEAVDCLKRLVKEVAENHAETSEIDDVLEKIKAIGGIEDKDAAGGAVSGREAGLGLEGAGPDNVGLAGDVGGDGDLEDEELMGIYADEMKAIWSRLDALMKGEDVDTRAVLS
ncbi:MAG: Hpt domain-containing protein, partial [Dissulfurimicrobium sp.]